MSTRNRIRQIALAATLTVATLSAGASQANPAITDLGGMLVTAERAVSAVELGAMTVMSPRRARVADLGNLTVTAPRIATVAATQISKQPIG